MAMIKLENVNKSFGDLHVLKDVNAPIEKRVENCISILGMDEKTARGMILDVDKARENYRRKYCKDIAGIFDNRDICIDSGKFGADTSADILCGVVRSVFD